MHDAETHEEDPHSAGLMYGMKFQEHGLWHT